MIPNSSTRLHENDPAHSTENGSDPRQRESAADVKIVLSSQEGQGEEGLMLGLWRHLAVSAGLLASDGGLVFLQLAMLPCLQSLGVPVALVTVTGCVSGFLGLLGLPLLGWASDGGTKPLRRKKIAVVLSALVFVAGYVAVISGCVVHLFADKGNIATDNVTNSTNLTSVSWRPSLSESDIPDLYLGVFPESRATQDTQSSSLRDTGDPSFADGKDDHHSFGISLAGVLAMLGFIFIDMGNDYNNSCLKGFVLASSAQVQHKTLFVVGVLMSAVGGCVSAVVGILDVGSLLAGSWDLEAVPTSTAMQCAFFAVVTLVCTMVSILSAPAFQANERPETPSSGHVVTAKQTGYGTMRGDHGLLTAVRITPEPSPESMTEDCAFHIGDEPVGLCEEDIKKNTKDFPKGTAIKTHVCLPDCKANNSLGTGDVEEESGSLMGETSQLLPRILHDSSKTENVLLRFFRAFKQAIKLRTNTNKIGLKISFRNLDYADQSSNCSTDECNTAVESGSEVMNNLVTEGDDNRRNCCFRNWKLTVVCTSLFFMAGAWQSFNICATDYLGKVIYGGNPDADPASEAYRSYQQGMRTGSLGVLVLNVVYVIVSLLQKRLLAAVGPRKECLAVCVVQVCVLLALQLTSSEVIFYVTSVVYGVFRAVMYTVPFMLANDICQEGASSLTGQGGGSAARVGSTMALVTAMMPLSYVLVSTFTGPLIHFTGNPGFPLMYATGATALAAIVFVFA